MADNYLIFVSGRLIDSNINIILWLQETCNRLHALRRTGVESLSLACLIKIYSCVGPYICDNIIGIRACGL